MSVSFVLRDMGFPVQAHDDGGKLIMRQGRLPLSPCRHGRLSRVNCGLLHRLESNLLRATSRANSRYNSSALIELDALEDRLSVNRDPGTERCSSTLTGVLSWSTTSLPNAQLGSLTSRSLNPTAHMQEAFKTF